MHVEDDDDPAERAGVYYPDSRVSLVEEGEIKKGLKVALNLRWIVNVSLTGLYVVENVVVSEAAVVVYLNVLDELLL
jgi:hypothetical protein